jgi:hypothetical protein
MQSSIFSTYSSEENRVTSSILAVMKFLSLQRTERLLGAIMEQSEFELVHFQNQPSKGGDGVPDASISSSCQILIETKIKRDTVSPDQLQRHLKRLNDNESEQFLLVLTPDESRPLVIDELQDKRIVWTSFASLDQAIEEILSDNQEIISEREAFLLRHLQIMLVEKNLIGLVNDVVVIPARKAWSEYNETNAYICQAERVFQPVKYLAFYESSQIHRIVPRILEIHDSIVFERGIHKGRLDEVVNSFIESRRREEGGRHKVILLSAPDDSQTQRLDEPIVNDLTSENGRKTAFTQNQRYVSLDRLKKARKTSELVGNK